MMSNNEQEELFNELVKEAESSQENSGDTGTIDPELLTQCSISKEKWLEETNK